MSSNKNKKAEKYLQYAVRTTGDKLVRNPSKKEQALLLCAVILSAVSLLLTVINAIAGGDAESIIRSLTLDVILFVLVIGLTISDKFLVVKGAKLLIVAHSVLELAETFIVFDSGSAGKVVLSVISVISAIAIYGFSIIDQFTSKADLFLHRVIYAGIAYRIVYIIVYTIVNGMINAGMGAIYVLDLVIGCFADIAVYLLLMYVTDRFSVINQIFNMTIEDVKTDIDDIKVPEIKSEEKPAANIFAGDDEEPGIQFITQESDSGIKYASGRYHPTKESIDDDAADTPKTDDIAVKEEKDNAEDDYEIKPIELDIIEEDPGNTNKADNDNGEKEDSTEENNYEGIVFEPAAPIFDIHNEENKEEIPKTDEVIPEEISKEEEIIPTDNEIVYALFASDRHKPDMCRQVESVYGKRYDIWIDGENICLQNDFAMIEEGDDPESLVIGFADVKNITRSVDMIGNDCVKVDFTVDNEDRTLLLTLKSFNVLSEILS